LQETKCNSERLPEDTNGLYLNQVVTSGMHDTGLLTQDRRMNHVWNLGMKKIPECINEGILQLADFGSLKILNLYNINIGHPDPHRMDLKKKFMKTLLNTINMMKDEPLLLLGDMNSILHPIYDWIQS